MPEIYKVLRTRVQNYGEGPLIDMEVSVVYGYNVAEGLVEFKKKIVKEIENFTDQVVPLVKSGLGLGYVPQNFAKDALAAGDVFTIQLKEETPHPSCCA
ncbi:hypothetical protein OBE_12519, partial [human gut metagenome]